MFAATIRFVAKCVAILGIALTLATHVANAMRRLAWPHDLVAGWRSLLADFWGAVTGFTGVRFSEVTTSFLTVCVFLAIAIASANRHGGTPQERSKFRSAMSVAGLILATLAILSLFVPPIAGELYGKNSLLKGDPFHIGFNVAAICGGFALLVWALAKFGHPQDLARQAWVFLGIYVCIVLLVLLSSALMVMDTMKEVSKTLKEVPVQASIKLPCEERNDCTVVPVFFGTNREQVPRTSRIDFGANRTKTLSLGEAIVTVPRKRRRGEVTRPSYLDLLSLKNPWKEDASIHFTIPGNGIRVFQNPDDFVRAVLAYGASEREFKDHAFIFVHGYNVTFDAGLYRTAQLAYDLGADGVPFGTAFLFSWPSGGETADYIYDFDSARLAVVHLRDFLQLVVSRSGAKRVHLIAHSMGNWPLLEALDKFTIAEPGGPSLNEIILAAPDIDLQEFEAIAQRVAKKAKGVTLYASSNDRAIIASRTVRRNVPRAGDVLADGPVVMADIDTIDVSALSMDTLSLNHSTYADRKELLSDIHRLMRTGKRPPDDRNERMKRVIKEGLPFWRYVE